MLDSEKIDVAVVRYHIICTYVIGLMVLFELVQHFLVNCNLLRIAKGRLKRSNCDRCRWKFVKAAVYKESKLISDQFRERRSKERDCRSNI